jgi:hypothetical protein
MANGSGSAGWSDASATTSVALPAVPPTTPASPWPPSVPEAAVTAMGSLPGLDPFAAQHRIFELLPDFPHLIELPDRGPGADMIGRGATFLTDLYVDLQPAGWRFVERAGRDLRRARDLISQDLDALAEAADGWTGALKVQAVGPWTLAATVELQRGDKALGDRGAVADLAASLADGLAAHVAHVRSLVPGATVVVQLDEPALPAVRAGHLHTASGFSALRIPEDEELSATLATVLAAVPFAGVHCCAQHVPVALLRGAGAGWIAVDASLLRTADDDALGEAIDGGTGLILGVDSTAGVDSVRDLARRLGFEPSVWNRHTLLSPPCGLAGRDERDAWEVLRRLPAAAARLADQVAG